MSTDKKVIAIIAQGQFGYHTDYYYWTRYLLPDYNVLYFHFNENKESCYLPGVTLYQLKKSSHKSLDVARMFLRYFRVSMQGHIDVTFIEYFRYCSLYRILFWKRFIVDNRSGYIEQNEIVRKCRNKMLSFEVSLFSFSTIVSESLRNELKINKAKCMVVPLGAEDFNFKHRYDEINILYVGVLDKRKIPETILGLSTFLNKHPVHLHFDIIGFGTSEETNKLMQTIHETELENIVTFHGPRWHKDMLKYLERASIGIVYIPRTPAYDNQPPTKLFEFIVNGIPVLATSTKEIARYVNQTNGVLIEDNPDSFARGLERLLSLLPDMNHESIKGSLKDHVWENIVRNILLKVIEKT
jgi:glycosyltransferase involved in cell wall biosynthesis